MTTTLLAREQIKLSPVPRKEDKRYFPRWDVNKRVEYSENGNTAIRSYTKDLSLDGASILVFGNPPAQHHVQLRIHLSDKEHFKAQGRVAWSKLEPTHELVGIIFRDLSPKAHVLITRHALSSEKAYLLQEFLRPHETPPHWYLFLLQGWPNEG